MWKRNGLLWFGGTGICTWRGISRPPRRQLRTPSDFANYKSGHGRELGNSETCQILISDAYTNSCMSQSQIKGRQKQGKRRDPLLHLKQKWSRVACSTEQGLRWEAQASWWPPSRPRHSDSSQLRQPEHARSRASGSHLHGKWRGRQD